MSITPDTKDWTWVLRLPCPECGYDASFVHRGDVSASVRMEAWFWRPALLQPNASERHEPGLWSTLEYGCHVRDVLTLFHERLTLMLAHDDPTFANWDQDRTAVEQRYDEADPQQVAEALERLGRQIATAFERLDEQQWQRTGRRSDGKTFTVESFARYLLHDLVHHRWDVDG